MLGGGLILRSPNYIVSLRSQSSRCRDETVYRHCFIASFVRKLTSLRRFESYRFCPLIGPFLRKLEKSSMSLANWGPSQFSPDVRRACVLLPQAQKRPPEGSFIVLGGGLEPPTPSSSGKCSTNWATQASGTILACLGVYFNCYPSSVLVALSFHTTA